MPTRPAVACSISKGLALLIALLLSGSTFAQSTDWRMEKTKQADPQTSVPQTQHAFFVSSPWFSFFNWIGESIDMYELHLGYRLTPDDKIGVKAATWRINKPMGIPLWDSRATGQSEYYLDGGRILEYGVGPFYQRMLWKGLFTGGEALILRKAFLDGRGKESDSGMRLYLSVHLGYYFSFFSDRVFIEPQIHCNYWPVDSKGPQGFAAREARWNNYFLFEPNIYFGVNLF